MKLAYSVITIFALGGGGVSQASSIVEELESFDEYLARFGKQYDSAEDYNAHHDIFNSNMAVIRAHNLREDTTYKMGVNHLTDVAGSELPLGYDKSHHALWHSRSEALAEDAEMEILPARKLSVSDLPLDLDSPVSDLPDSVDWRSKGVATPVKNQGGCGSCWAFASCATLESHVALASGKLFELSVQELVSCTPNPNHCGGDGGCTGSTSELAFDFAAKYGMVDEWTFGYQSIHGEVPECSLLSAESTKLRGQSNLVSQKIKGAVASIVGFAKLPANEYSVLMNAVAKMGPVAISVAANSWGLYASGIFDDADKEHRDVNHLVVLMGYGTDEETNQDYWLVRNSWGPLWGEDGYIRLKRVDPSTLDDPDSDCRMDVTPADGVACTKDDDGNDIKPKSAKACGTSGLLFDSTVPVGAHIL